jgi:exosome complex component RRP4
MGLEVKEKELVVPGDILATGMDFLPALGTFREGENIIANQIGLVNVDGRLIKLVLLKGVYNPKVGDTVIGKVSGINITNWMVNIGYAYDAGLSLKDATSEFIQRGADLSKYYDIGDYVVAKLVNVTKQKLIDLTMKGPGLKKLKGGRIIKITPTKVPRIIGKKGSMITLIKDSTNCQITVGQNGWVWIQGENPNDELKAEQAVLKVNNESHKDGLTDEITKFLGGKK